MPIWLQLLGMLLTGSLLTSVFNAWANRRKSGADVSKLFAETAGQLVEQSNKQMKDIREQLGELKRENGGAGVRDRKVGGEDRPVGGGAHAEEHRGGKYAR